MTGVTSSWALCGVRASIYIYIYIYIRVFCESRAETVDSAKVPTGIVQCKVYPGAFSVPEVEENIRINSRADIEVRGVSSGELSVALES